MRIPGRTTAAGVKLILSLVLAAGLAVAGGCAIMQPPPEAPPAPDEPPVEPAGDETPPPRDAAVAALGERAATAFRAGRFGEAAATLERALAIDARDASLWLDLGWVRLAQGDTAQARVLASRAHGLTGDAALQCRADRLARSNARGREAIAARSEAARECGPARG